MWVKLRVMKNIKRKGVQKAYKPGDWVEVGRQLALEWVAAGVAELATEHKSAAGLDATAGIVVVGPIRTDWLNRVEGITGLQCVFVNNDWSPELLFLEQLIYKPEFEPRLDLFLVGFKQLKVFQVAVPLWDYETLAAHIGSEDEREETKEVIRDLRVPLRDDRLMFMRRCDLTRSLLAQYANDVNHGKDRRLSLLRSIYQHKPLICDLPAQWTGNVKD